MVSVTITVEPAGQSGTSGAHEVTVYVDVEKIVEVVRLSGGYEVIVESGAVVGPETSVVVPGAGMVVEPGTLVGSGVETGEPPELEPGREAEVDGSGPDVEAVEPVGFAPSVEDTEPVAVSVMGQTVVEMGIVSVTTTVELAGQLGTSGAHEVTV
jgi:hypothetical protein